MKKKVAFFTTYIPSPHYETELEIMQEHLNIGDEVYQIFCDKFFTSCTSNMDGAKNICNFCKSKRHKGLKLLSKEVKKINLTNYQKAYPDTNLKFVFQNFEEIKNYKLDNYDIGMSILSTLVSHYRTPYFSIDEAQHYIKNNIENGFKTYKAVINLLNQQKFDRVYIFNGRFTIERAILRACEYMQQPYYTHERGCDKDHYEIFENTLPHSILYNHQKMLERWQKEKETTQKMEIAESFFMSRINKTWKWTGWIKALDNQQVGVLPTTWDKEKHNIIIYTTSDNEFFAIGDEYKTNLFSNQISGIKHIGSFLQQLQDNSIQIYVRLHPFLADAPFEHEYVLKQLQEYTDVFHIIPADSTINSYDLLLHCDKVITFGSTMGIEATFHGKPSISLTSCGYQFLDVAYQPLTQQELWELLLDKNLLPKNKENTLPYAFYYETMGKPFKYYQAKDFFSGTFKGEKLEGINVEHYEFHMFKQNIKKVINQITQREIFKIYA